MSMVSFLIPFWPLIPPARGEGWSIPAVRVLNGGYVNNYKLNLFIKFFASILSYSSNSQIKTTKLFNNMFKIYFILSVIIYK